MFAKVARFARDGKKEGMRRNYNKGFIKENGMRRPNVSFAEVVIGRKEETSRTKLEMKEKKEIKEEGVNKKVSLDPVEYTDVDDVLKEKIIVSLGKKEVKVRVKEIEELMFQPCKRIAKSSKEEEEFVESESEEEVRSEGSVNESSENFSSEKDEESFGESFMKESSPEVIISNLKGMSSEKIQADKREEHKSDTGNFEKTDEVEGEDKLSNKIDEIKDTKENTRGEIEGATMEDFEKQEMEFKKDRKLKKKEEEKNSWEKRVTRSQARKSRSKESNEESLSTEEKSSSYLLGEADSDQKISETGAKCGIHRRNGREISQSKGNKNGAFRGNQ
ncbi:hypothetical protein L2E82_47889 [Cichorium intybus]|uniref:Uncharacterized protein n=1 Tax=Cichorium intybus TaxID=13427 RepID=A0ACB8YY86_CICIN|nr:hypothetical protein L2E82_47889 [Cichorium intybus]